MKTATLIFPHQLFEHHPAISKERELFGAEEQLLFSGIEPSLKFHKKKLILHRASMQAYKKRLESQGYLVHSKETEGAEKGRFQKLYLARHPYLKEFISSPACALLKVEVETYYVVNRFQNAMELHIRK